jgi:hypothetical protein
MMISFPDPPIDRNHVEEVHRYLRRKAAEATPSADPLVREMQEGLASGRLRGRDLLRIGAYRDHLMGSAERMVDEYCRLSAAEREELRQRGLTDLHAEGERDGFNERG